MTARTSSTFPDCSIGIRRLHFQLVEHAFEFFPEEVGYRAAPKENKEIVQWILWETLAFLFD